MKIKSLGHVVLRVADRDRAEQFYSGVLGLECCAHFDDPGARMAFFTLGNHHDLAVMEVGAEAPRGASNTTGLDHVAFCIGTSMDELREAKSHLDASGIASTPIDHEVTKSLYLEDPDGNGVELYVDVSDAWRRDPQRVAQIKPLVL